MARRIQTGRSFTLALVLTGILLGSSASSTAASDRRSTDGTSTDIGLETGFQDTELGHLQRGRALVSADFNLDGRNDFYVGNPGDESYVLVNQRAPGGQAHFAMGPTLLTGTLSWGATAFDYDNDGDPDIFDTDGGNEGIGFDHLFANQWVPTGELAFTDVTDAAGVAGPVPQGAAGPIPVSNAGAVAGDFDLDGWTDVFVSVNITPESLPRLRGRNILWHNDGDGTFTDATNVSGLGVTRAWTRHSSWIDYDNDGDLDLYENNFQGLNHMWQNRLKEDGVARFVDVTKRLSPPGESLACPWQSFASAPTDFNNDGWEDLIVFMRWTTGGEPPKCPYGPGHAIFMNMQGRSFVNVAEQAGLTPFVFDKGVMGCQVGDLNGDGAPDVFVGNGAPMDADSPLGGQFNQLFMSSQDHGDPPMFVDETPLIDFPAPEKSGLRYPPYPYRTHGTVMTDVDRDGSQELAVSEGGPSASPDYVREPDRLFKFTWDMTPNWLIVHPEGDGGAHVSADAIGTRLALTVRDEHGNNWTIHQTLFGGSCFSASNGFDLYFGLSNATSVDSLEVTWPDGTSEVLTTGVTINTRMTIRYGESGAAPRAGGGPPATDTTGQLLGLLAARPRTPKAEFAIPAIGSIAFSCDRALQTA
jgi:hypothetical protein